MMMDVPNTASWQKRHVRSWVLFFMALALSSQSLLSQSGPDVKLQRNRGMVMLQGIREYLEEYYYDPQFHGMDVKARFGAAAQKINESTSTGQIFGIIAQTLAELDDSHTYFVPPSRSATPDYGWKMQMVGEDCFVIAVKPGSDAEAQSLKPGDKVISVDGFRPTRSTLWKMEYSYNMLRPQPGIRVIVQPQAGEQRELAIKAAIIKDPKQINLDQLRYKAEEEEEDEKKLPKFYEVDPSVVIWKLRGFGLTERKIDDFMGTVRKYKTLVLDLRGNGGGYEKSLQRLVSYFFDREVVIADAKGRKKTTPVKAKPRSKVFTGKLVVLVDSNSGSAAEIFARFVQLEKRGLVLGDKTAGAVMRSRFYPGLLGDMSSGNMIPYGVSVTEADVIMSDGKSLEHVGVIPDELLVPSATDMAANRDVVLARAVELAGAKLTAETAGTLFPYEWKK